MRLSKKALITLLSITTTVTTVSGFSVSPHHASVASLHDSLRPAFASPYSYPRCSSTTSSSSLFMAGDPTKITMPALSSTMKEGRIVSWLKGEGDAIEAGEAIMVVESDKADMDVEAFEDGFLAKILVDEGDSADVGATVALVVEEEADIASVSVAGLDSGGAAVDNAVEAVAPNGDTTGATASFDFATTEIFMPALSSTMSEGKIVSWLKSPGDKIEAGEAIMVVESDKADMDVEAFEDGYLAMILTEEGEMADVGAPVGIIVEEEDQVDKVQQAGPITGGAPAAPVAATAAPPKAAVVPPPVAPPAEKAADGARVVASPLAKKRAEELGVDLTTVAGTGPNGRITAGDVEEAAKGGGAAPKKEATKPAHVPAPGVVAATPSARAAAKKAKIDIATIAGTGQFGRVTLEDVQMATGEKKAPKKTKKTAPGEPEPIEMPEGTVPFTGMQRAVSNNMEATLTTPVFRASREIQMDKFDSLYQSMKPKGVTVSALLAKAVAMAIEKHPIINSSYDPSGGIVYNPDINIAMAVAIDGGLITPTLKYANERSIIELGENWKELVGKAKTGTLSPDEYNSGTFTISNLGMFGISQFDAILPVGQGCILAIGATSPKVVPDAQAVLGLKTIKSMTVTITCDHRQIYGADAALFMKTLANIMENETDSLVL